MNDRELEQRLRAWYGTEVGETEVAPDAMRQTLTTIPATTRLPLRARDGRRPFTLLAVAAVLIVGGAIAAGSGLVRPTPVVTPVPNVAVVAPSESAASATPVPTPNVRPGSLIAYIRTVDNRGRAHANTRLWMVGTDGRGGHEVFPEGESNQGNPVWSPDGRHLLYVEEGKLYLTDAGGSSPEPVNTGCMAPCLEDFHLSFSSDGRSIVFGRHSTAETEGGVNVIATMDLSTGSVAELRSTRSEVTGQPSWSPDAKQIVFFKYGEDDGSSTPRLDGLWLVDADGENLRPLSPTTLAAAYPRWSPDGSRIVFESRESDRHDIYTIRPDGKDLQALTTDGASTSATWTPDGRILFARAGGGSPGWWTMDADGSGAAILLSDAAVGVPAADLGYAAPTWQPIGGAAIVPPPWNAATAVGVGPTAPPTPTPAPTATPSLSPGFAWTGSMIPEGVPAGQSATLLTDGRVLFAGGCTTAAQLYDPATGLFRPTGNMTAPRAASAATLLLDGQVLFTGGSNCAPAGQDGIWASAELYDPTTGTFSPTGFMAAPRQQHTTTRLADGRVLVAGGMSGTSPATAGRVTLASYQTADVDAFLATAEVYDPTTRGFSRTGSMGTPHQGHTATLLADGRVLVAGNGGESSPSGTSADVYDPATGEFSQTGPMKTGRWLHTATLLSDGRVLILGGRSPRDSVYRSAETFDPRSGKFSSAGSMGEGRQQQTATLLPDGRVLIAGGYWSDGQEGRVLSSTEIYDPTTGEFSPTGSMGAPRIGHGATLLNDGRVLIASGVDIGNSGAVEVAPAVLYQP